MAPGRRRDGPRSAAGRSSRVAEAALVLQQQLLVEADLLQPLAQFVQLTAQLLALELLQHQVLPEQGEDARVGREPSRGGLARALLRAEQPSSRVMADSGVLRAEQTVQRDRRPPGMSSEGKGQTRFPSLPAPKMTRPCGNMGRTCVFETPFLLIFEEWL